MATHQDATYDIAAPSSSPSLRVPIVAGLAVGVVQAAAPLGLWWLPARTVYGMSIALIATVYIGFAVADGRRKVVSVETAVAAAFVVIAAVAVAASPWVGVAGLLGHGAKDLWQHRTGFVRGTRWWPPFCACVDVTAAALVAGAIIVGVPIS